MDTVESIPAPVDEVRDKLVALGDKVGPNEKYGALYARAFAFNSLSAADQAAHR